MPTILVLHGAAQAVSPPGVSRPPHLRPPPERPFWHPTQLFIEHATVFAKRWTADVDCKGVKCHAFPQFPIGASGPWSRTPVAEYGIPPTFLDSIDHRLTVLSVGNIRQRMTPCREPSCRHTVAILTCQHDPHIWTHLHTPRRMSTSAEFRGFSRVSGGGVGGSNPLTSTHLGPETCGSFRAR